MTTILYLAHDLDDSAIWRRVSMLEAAGAVVEVAGFQRSTTPPLRPATVLGQTHSGRFLHRALSALRLLFRAGDIAPGTAPDVILARNLEMLPLARRIRGRFARDQRPQLVYEVLDIHRLLVGSGPLPAVFRAVERRLCRGVDKVLISSPRFDKEHFRRYGQVSAPVVLVENKIWDPDHPDAAPEPVRPPRRPDDPLVIGWFGILRCAQSLRCLDALSRLADGRLRVVLRGRPALDALPEFHRTVEANPWMEFLGPYRYPQDLPQIYGSVDVAWLIDRFDAGANSDWLLPNRLYESCAHGAIPLALQGTETGSQLTRRGLGLVVPDLRPDAVALVLASLDDAALAALRAGIAATDPADWRTTRQECARLIDQLAGRASVPRAAVHLISPEPVENAG